MLDKYKRYSQHLMHLLMMTTISIAFILSACSSPLSKNSFEKYPRALYAPLNFPQDDAVIATAVRELESRLSTKLNPDPFILEGNTMHFDWCRKNPRRNQSLKDLIKRLEAQSARTRDLAQLYAATKDLEFASEAILILTSWSEESTLLNGYRIGMNPADATFSGVERGFCNRSWNMLLDSIWQTYGLLNFSISYGILSQDDQILDIYDQELIKAKHWLRTELIPAVNSGFHAWTKYADFNPRSAAYERYRSDNHISWCLAGLATAGLALNDKALLDYVYYGTGFDDGISGPYNNPSSLLKFIPLAIGEDGSVYDQHVRAKQHKGYFYGNFSLWALVMAASATEKAGYPPLWNYATSESGSITLALEYYARYASGELPLPDPEEETSADFFSFVYRLALPYMDAERDNLHLLTKAAKSNSGAQYIKQGPGSISLTTPEP